MKVSWLQFKGFRGQTFPWWEAQEVWVRASEMPMSLPPWWPYAPLFLPAQIWNVVHLLVPMGVAIVISPGLSTFPPLSSLLSLPFPQNVLNERRVIQCSSESHGHPRPPSSWPPGAVGSTLSHLTPARKRVFPVCAINRIYLYQVHSMSLILWGTTWDGFLSHHCLRSPYGGVHFSSHEQPVAFQTC